MDERVVIPATEGRAVELAAGDRLSIIDLEGSQVADVFVFVDGDLGEYLSASHTRAAASRLVPEVGGVFVTNRRRPILRILADTSPGIHDLLMAACDSVRYAALGHPGHASCVGNLDDALASMGLAIADPPQAVNMFMNVPVGPAGSLSWLPAASGPGDSFTVEALLDCVVVVSACPQDLVPINGGRPTAIALELSRADRRPAPR